MTEDNFPLEKILNVNIRDYVESKGRTLEQYDLQGVHTSKARIKKFAELVPKDAEVVVNYQHQFFGAGSGSYTVYFQHYQSGIALIPKKE